MNPDLRNTGLKVKGNKMIDKVDAHREIVLELNNTYERKNIFD